MDGANLRVLSRSSSSASVNSAVQASSSSSSIPLSSSSVPYMPTSSNFNFPPAPHSKPPSSYSPLPPAPPPPPPQYLHPPPPPLPSVSLLNTPRHARALPASSNSISPGAKVTILTSSASALPSSVSTASLSGIPSSISTDVAYTTASGQGHAMLPGGDTLPANSSDNGIVVVGVIGRSEEDVWQLLNRILDAQVFGSQSESCKECNVLFESAKSTSTFSQDTGIAENGCNSSGNIFANMLHEEGPVMMDGKHPDVDASHKRAEWIKTRFKYYHDEEKGVVYVQFAWGCLPTQSVIDDSAVEGISSVLQESEGFTLRGLLYMFSVCHVVLLVQEGARIDTHLLQTLRLLQNAKHLLAPYVKMHVLQGLLPSPATAPGRGAPTRPSSRSSTGHSPGRGGVVGRSGSTIALMSGSAPSLFPGQCTPVLLFVFLEDFLDTSVTSSPQTTEPHVSTVGSLLSTRQSSQIKGFNAVVMLARSSNKAEGGLRKKLQSSLEAQIRYLVKKCRVLAGSSETLLGSGVGAGQRVGSISGTTSGSALFVLDTMRVACLVDKGSNLKGEALEATMAVMIDMIKGKKVAAVDALSELTDNAGEDIQAIRDFLWKQAEILRGRGGVLSNSTGGSMGVGMVAAAAAAAAASAAAGAFGGSGGVLKSLNNPPELPSMSNWQSACRKLVEALVGGEPHSTGEMTKTLSTKITHNVRGTRKGPASSPNPMAEGKDALAVTLASLECGMGLDMKFSAEWCKRMLPTAIAAYTKGLPPCYPTVVHQSHLERALLVLKSMVRGPAVPLYMEKLREECVTIWKSGRQLCDAVSLTGKPCVHKVHESQTSDSHAKPHSSGVVFLHSCACGRSRRLRDDPFDYEDANATFYKFPNCCEILPSLIVPNCEGNNPLGGSAWSAVRLGGARYYQPSTGLLQSGFCHNKKYLSSWNVSYASKTAGIPRATPRLASQAHEQDLIPKASRSLVGSMSFLDALERGNVQVKTMLIMDKKNKLLEKSERKPEPVGGPSVPWDDRRLFADVVVRNARDGDTAFPPLQQKQVHPGPRNTRQGVLKEKKDAFVSEPPRILGKFEQPALKIDNDSGLRTITPLVAGGTLPPTDTESAGIVDYITLYVGFEHECPRGHRFLLSPSEMEALSSSASVAEQKITEINLKGSKDPSSISLSMQHEVAFKDLPLQNADVHSDRSGEGYTLINMNLPIYMACPYCNKVSGKRKKNAATFAGNISQLQRIFVVTPPLPLLVAASPVVQFDKLCVPPSVRRDGICTNEFGLGCSVVLPPESFVILRLPFVYCTELDDGSRCPLQCKLNHPESTAWLLKGSALRIISKDKMGMHG